MTAATTPLPARQVPVKINLSLLRVVEVIAGTMWRVLGSRYFKLTELKTLGKSLAEIIQENNGGAAGRGQSKEGMISNTNGRISIC